MKKRKASVLILHQRRTHTHVALILQCKPEGLSIANVERGKFKFKIIDVHNVTLNNAGLFQILYNTCFRHSSLSRFKLQLSALLDFPKKCHCLMRYLVLCNLYSWIFIGRPGKPDEDMQMVRSHTSRQ